MIWDGVVETGIDFGAAAARRRLERIGVVLLVGSGKGGVGKSLVSCGLALALRRDGYSVGLLDVDVHGASVPACLRVRPPVSSSARGLEPKRVEGIHVMSPALFTGDNPVPVRGDGKEALITQLFALTDWGSLDYLVVDLPPSTGDELLTAFSLFRGKSSLILVTTPSPGATSVVKRLASLAVGEGVPLEGVVINMAYMKRGKEVVHPFGTASAAMVGRALGAKVLVEVPLEPRVSSLGLPKTIGAARDLRRSFVRLASLVTA